MTPTQLDGTTEQKPTVVQIELDELNRLKSERDDAVSSRGRWQQHVKALEKALGKRNTRIYELEQQGPEDLRRQLSERDQRIAALEKARPTQLVQQLKDARQAVVDRNREVAALKAKLLEDAPLARAMRLIEKHQLKVSPKNAFSRGWIITSYPPRITTHAKHLLDGIDQHCSVSSIELPDMSIIKQAMEDIEAGRTTDAAEIARTLDPQPTTDPSPAPAAQPSEPVEPLGEVYWLRSDGPYADSGSVAFPLLNEVYLDDNGFPLVAGANHVPSNPNNSPKRILRRLTSKELVERVRRSERERDGWKKIFRQNGEGAAKAIKALTIECDNIRGSQEFCRKSLMEALKLGEVRPLENLVSTLIEQVAELQEEIKRRDDKGWISQCDFCQDHIETKDEAEADRWLRDHIATCPKASDRVKLESQSTQQQATIDRLRTAIEKHRTHWHSNFAKWELSRQPKPGPSNLELWATLDSTPSESEPQASQDRTEKQIRIEYQDIVYKLCNLVDRYRGNNITRGEGISTAECVEKVTKLISEKQLASQDFQVPAGCYLMQPTGDFRIGKRGEYADIDGSVVYFRCDQLSHECKILRKIDGPAVVTQTSGESLNLEQHVRELIARNAKHLRKGTVMGQETWSIVFQHLQSEITELTTATAGTSRENVLEELGDVLGIVVHAILKAGFSVSEVEQREIAKLKERFSQPSSAPPVPSEGESRVYAIFNTKTNQFEDAKEINAYLDCLEDELPGAEKTGFMVFPDRAFADKLLVEVKSHWHCNEGLEVRPFTAPPEHIEDPIPVVTVMSACPAPSRDADTGERKVRAVECRYGVSHESNDWAVENIARPYKRLAKFGTNRHPDSKALAEEYAAYINGTSPLHAERDELKRQLAELEKVSNEFGLMIIELNAARKDHEAMEWLRANQRGLAGWKSVAGFRWAVGCDNDCQTDPADAILEAKRAKSPTAHDPGVDPNKRSE